MTVINIEDRVLIPPWVVDLDSFGRWSRSPDFPERGGVAYLDGELWVDLSMEELFSHNQVKAAFTLTIMTLLQASPLGRFVPDRMRLINPIAGLSTEPDGLFYSWETIQSGQLRLVENENDGCLELDGSPDMVLEIVSRTSVRKDTVTLRKLYHRAEIDEYWLVNALGDVPRFEILRNTSKGFRVANERDGWQTSSVFDRRFRLCREQDPLGHPQYVVDVRMAE